MPQTHIHLHSDSTSKRIRPAEIIAAILLERYAECVAPVLVAIGGPGGTGKSTFAEKLQHHLNNCPILRLDDYKRSRTERYPHNFFGAAPEANQIELLKNHLATLKEGQSIDKPVYNSKLGKCDRTTPFSPDRFVILDGEIATYDVFKDLVDFKIFIDSDWQTQLQTRINRDIADRGYDPEKAIDTFLNSNLREFRQYGAASRQSADIHLYCRHDYRLVIESVKQALFQQHQSLFTAAFHEVTWQGLYCPLLTPFDADGCIDQTALLRHLEFLTDHSVERILVNGTSAEFFSLHPRERRQILTLVEEYFPGLVVFQAGSDSQALTRDEIRWAEDYGADGVMVLPPYYYANVHETGLIRYLSELSENLSIPFLLYNFPQHTQNPLTPNLLNQVPHFALKDSDYNLALLPHTPCYLVGSDTRIPAAIQSGAKGFVSATANLLPAEYVQLEGLAENQQWEEAEQLQQEIDQKSASLRNPQFLSHLKYRLAQQLPGYPSHVRRPLCDWEAN